MQCLIFAAGKGTRMRPLTETRPKPLIEVAGRPILAHIIEALPDEIDELIVVISYLGDQVQAFLGDTYAGRSVRYVKQTETSGTAHALKLARPHLHGKFLVLAGDDLHGKEALEEALAHDLAIIVAPSEHPERFGVVEVTSQGNLKTIVEKPEHPTSNLVSTGALVLDERIFDYDAPMHKNGEYYLTDMFAGLAKDVSVAVIEQPFWMPIGYPEDIPRAEAALDARVVQ